MILVFEQDQEDHDSPLMNTLNCLEGANSEKCAFRKHMLKFLGHEHGVRADLRKFLPSVK